MAMIIAQHAAEMRNNALRVKNFTYQIKSLEK